MIQSSLMRLPMPPTSGTGIIQLLNSVQKGRCAYCGMGFDQLKRRRMRNRKGVPTPACRRTREHLDTKLSGGKDNLLNSVGACFKCNNARGTLALDYFLDNRSLSAHQQAIVAEIALALRDMWQEYYGKNAQNAYLDYHFSPTQAAPAIAAE